MTWHPPTTMGDARDSAASPLTPDEEDDKAGVTAFGVSHYESTAKLHVKAPPVRPPVGRVSTRCGATGRGRATPTYVAMYRGLV